MELREYPALGERVFYEKMPDGLPVYVLSRPGSSRQFAFFAARCGGSTICIPDGCGGWETVPAGTAHYLEHKMFDMPDGGASEKFGESGAADNAFTSASMTGYYFTGTRDFEQNLRILLDMVSVPYFTAESVEKERGIIEQEVRMTEDDPGDESYSRLLEMMYAADPVRTRVVGSTASIREITPELLYRFHKACYRAGNMVLVVGGDLDAGQVCSVVRETLGDRLAGTAWIPPVWKEPEDCICHERTEEMEVAVPLFQMGFKGAAAPAGRRMRQELMARLACDALASPSAPLYSRLYDAGVINGEFSCVYDESTETSARLVFGGESEDSRQVRDALLAETERLGREGIDAALWERLVRAAYGSKLRELDDLREVCIGIAAAHLEGEDYFSFPALFAELRKEDAEELLRSWCTKERCALFEARPKGGAQGAAD